MRLPLRLVAAGGLLLAVVLPAARAELYGLSMVHNSPVEDKLVRITSTGGNYTEVSGPLKTETGTDDLRAVDTSRGVYYFLGDTHAGATLVGLQLTDGAQVCKQVIPLSEVGFVGLGQSMTYVWTPRTPPPQLSSRISSQGSASLTDYLRLSGP